MAARVVTIQRLTALSKSLMKQASNADGTITCIIDYRDGLMIGLLAWRPLRRRTFSLITTRTHLYRTGREWRMIFDGPEIKSGRPLETSIPGWITPFLERYLREARPRVLGATQHDGL